MMKPLGIITIAMVLALSACQSKRDFNGGTESAAGESPAASMTAEEASSMMGGLSIPAPDATAGMAGHWQGPEGTSLVITPADGGFDVIVTNLDGPRTFHGKTASQGISFERDGKVLTIRRGSGADTGMKDLADKSDCLVVAANEGYCRD